MRDGDMPDSSDADLVAGARDADHAAFAAIYDRYADRIYDFCWSMLRNSDDAADTTQDTFLRAVERLGQLRDPAMLRSWLYSIAKHEALARLRLRRRQVPDDSVPDTPDVSPGPESAARQNELRDLVWAAAGGLAERDQLLLNLHLRHGLDGAELAEAAGIRANNVYVMLGRFRERVERSLGAFLVARLGREDCTELDAILSGWDGRFSVLIRKRVARHVDTCTICSERRRTAASPMALLSTLPIMTAPPELREIVLSAFDAHGGHDNGAGGRGESGASGAGHPWHTHPVRTSALAVAGVGALTAVIVAGALFLNPPSDPTSALPASETTTAETEATAAPAAPSAVDLDIGASADLTPRASETSASPIPTEPTNGDAAPDPAPQDPPDDPQQPEDPVPEDPSPGELVLSTQDLDLGSGERSGIVTLANTGETAITYEVAPQTSWLSVDHGGGELAAEAARDLVIIADRTSLDEGDYVGTIEISSTGADATITVSLAVAGGPPIINDTQAPTTIMCGRTATVRAQVTDEPDVSGLEVKLAWTTPAGERKSTQMSGPDNSWWQANLTPDAQRGEIVWTVIATDDRGNTDTSGGSITVTCIE